MLRPWQRSRQSCACSARFAEISLSPRFRSAFSVVDFNQWSDLSQACAFSRVSTIVCTAPMRVARSTASQRLERATRVARPDGLPPANRPIRPRRSIRSQSSLLSASGNSQASTITRPARVSMQHLRFRSGDNPQDGQHDQHQPGGDDPDQNFANSGKRQRIVCSHGGALLRGKQCRGFTSRSWCFGERKGHGSPGFVEAALLLGPRSVPMRTSAFAVNIGKLPPKN